MNLCDSKRCYTLLLIGTAITGFKPLLLFTSTNIVNLSKPITCPLYRVSI